MTPDTTITLQANTLGSMISRYVEIGFSMAVKLYNPTTDAIRKSEVEKWLMSQALDVKKFRALQKNEMIKPFKKGNGTNSPYYYSKSDILQAYADADISMIDAQQRMQL